MLRSAGTAAWRASVVLMGSALIAIPVYGPLMPSLEGDLLPVTTRLVLLDPVTLEPLVPVPDPDGWISLRFSYEKLRSCQYVGVEAQVAGLRIEMEQAEGSTGTRLPGKQVSSVWRLHTASLRYLKIFFVHRCSPLWITITEVFG